MRIAVAQIRQETNTFNPIPSDLTDFEEGGLYFGGEILEKMRGVGEIGGLIAVVEEEAGEVELLPIIRAAAMSGGPMTAETLEFFGEKLVSGLEKSQPVDAVFLSMHGAAASEKVDDVEGYLLAAVRGVVGDDIHVVVPLDHHGNITRRIIELADVIVGYQTCPHDPFETGMRAAKILLALVKGDISPTVGWQKIPMLTHSDRYNTAEWPMKGWFGLARELEKHPRVISVSTFPMQPWLDVAEAGWTAVVYTDNDLKLAQESAAELADKAWELREEFWVLDRLPLEEAIRRAAEAEEGPIMICDGSDCVPCGAPGDGTWLLKEILRQEIECTAVLPMVDPEVVEEAMRAGVGSEITVQVGGKRDHVFSEPVEVTGRVTGVSEGAKAADTRFGSYGMGGTVLLEVGSIKIVVSEERGMGEIPPDVYAHFGLDPAEAKMIVVKKPRKDLALYLHPLIKGELRVDCPGLAGWDLKQFHWVRRPHPLYPLDELPEWQAKA
jgi:microcystin degradation protein MlrC